MPRKLSSNEAGFVSKITPKDLGNPRAAAALDHTDPTAAHFLGEVLGRATGFVTKEDQRTGNVYFPLVGNFTAFKGTDGAKISSGVLYLPGGIHEMILSQFQGDEPAKEVEFWMEIWTKPVASSPGYAYMLVNKKEVEAKRDPLSDLIAYRENAMKALTDESEKAEPVTDQAIGKAARSKAA